MNVHAQMCTAAGLQAVAKEWWDCEITLDLAENLSAKYAKESKNRVKQDIKNGYFITAAGPLVWLKMRLNARNLLPVSGNAPTDDKPTDPTATLRVGFLSLVETEEMLARLQNELLNEDANNPARSKMFETAQKQDITPIDATAGIVTKTKQDNT